MDRITAITPAVATITMTTPDITPAGGPRTTLAPRITTPGHIIRIRDPVIRHIRGPAILHIPAPVTRIAEAAVTIGQMQTTIPAIRLIKPSIGQT